jgi:hypothetical protein
MGQGGGGDEGRVLDAYAVVDFVPFAETAKDGDGVLDGGFGYGNGLETAFEGCVFLNIFTILVEGGGADAVQFPSGEHGFQHIASVHSAFGFACTDDGMDFVDEKNDGSLGLDHLVEDGFEALFEFASELGPRNQGGQIEGNNPFFLETLGNIARHDATGESFDDGGFTNARLADEDGVVFGTAREDLDGAPDL